MVGNNDRRSSGLFRLQRPFYGHDSFHNKWRTGHLDDLPEFLHSLASCRRFHIFQKRKTGRINIHSHRKGSGLMNQCHFFTDGLNVPGLHRRNPDATRFFDGCSSCHHYVTVHAISGKSSNAVFRTGRHQNIVISHIIQTVPVMKGNGSHRTCENRIEERFSKKLQ